MRKRAFLASLSIFIILILLLVSVIGCVPKRNTTLPTEPSTDSNSTSTNPDIAELEEDIKDLRSRIASQPDYSNEIAQLRQEIESVRDMFDSSQDDIDTALEGALDTIDAKIAEWAEGQVTTQAQNTDASTSPEDAIEIAITQPYTTYTVPELVADAEYTQTFLLTLSLENTLSISIKDILIMAMAYPYTTHPYPSIDVNITGGILFNRYSSNMFQSWGPLSLKAEQKKSYQLTVIVTIVNTGTDTILSSTLSVPMQAYCVDYSD